MTSHTIRNSPLRWLQTLAAACSLLICSMSSVWAKSDTNVTIIMAEKVVIGKDAITIIGKGLITSPALAKWPGAEGTNWRGTINPVRATFIIKRPPLNFNDPDGTHAEEREKVRKVLDDAWKMSLTAAKELQAGREVGRIGFYNPEIRRKGNLIDSIVGFGYLYPKR